MSVRREQLELACRFVQAKKPAVGNTEIGAVQDEFACLLRSPDVRERAQIGDRFDDRGAAEPFGIVCRWLRPRAEFGCSLAQQGNPLADEIARRQLHIEAGLRFDIGAHAAAHRMAHDDNVPDF